MGCIHHQERIATAECLPYGNFQEFFIYEFIGGQEGVPQNELINWRGIACVI